MTLDSILDALKEKLLTAPHIGAAIKFDLGEDGIILIDGTKTPPELSQDDGDAVTTFQCSRDTFVNILQGTQDPTMAYMMGKVKIKGSMGYAMKISAFLGD